MSILLEPIKTALTAGDAAGARRERLKLLRDAADDLGAALNDMGGVDGWAEVIDMVDALGIPEE